MTDRALTPGMSAALVNMRPVFFYEGEFTGGTLRLCTEPHTVSWNGHDWLGMGVLLSVSKITESTEIRAHSFTVTLNHALPSTLTAALSQCRQGKPGTVWVGAWDASKVIVPDPYLAYEGRLDVPEIVMEGESGRITISYEGRLISLERPHERRITHLDQVQEFPGDMFREYVSGLQDKVISF